MNYQQISHNNKNIIKNPKTHFFGSCKQAQNLIYLLKFVDKLRMRGGGWFYHIWISYVKSVFNIESFFQLRGYVC